MVNYKVEQDKVIELSTGQVIKENLNNTKAKELCRSLNFGGGFDGNTPAFFLEKIKKVEFTDESFYK